MEFDAVEWCNKVCNKDTIVTFKGNVTSNVIDELLDKIENRLMEFGEKSRVIRRIYYVSVETLQNLFHHSEKEKEFENFFSFFVLKRINPGVYKIITGNFVKKQNIRLLKNRIDQINYLTKEEIKILYKLILNNDEFSNKGGGGLGLIDIARKTGHKLSYDFKTYNPNYNFFTLNVVIS